MPSSRPTTEDLKTTWSSSYSDDDATEGDGDILGVGKLPATQNLLNRMIASNHYPPMVDNIHEGRNENNTEVKK